MAELLNSLDTIGTTYTVFEKDQVLTEKQLNGVVQFLDSQARLTRVELLGVGIAGGLRVSIIANGSGVSLTKGVGVTTDGDLLYVLDDTVYVSFKERGADAPGYAKLGSGGALIPAWELVAKGVDDDTAIGLNLFTATTGRALGDLTGLLLMETYAKDQDLCSGTECDNLGKLSLHDLKLVLVPKSATAPLQESLTTPDAAARLLDDVAADRPMLAGISTLVGLGAAYHNACTAILGKLTTALGKLHAVCQPFLVDLYPTDPTGAWIAKLQQVVAQLSSASAGVQYAYEFLGDVVETYAAFREQLFDDTTVCCPDQGAFPKHLLLGDLTAPADSDVRRTGHYPSPAVTAAAHHLDHARFLLRKLGALIGGFVLPSSGAPIRITPSYLPDRALEERAIPYYYDPTTAVHQWWNHALRRRGMSDYNYSYHAVDPATYPATYPAKGAAAAPFAASIGRFSFFRIEGHRGKAIASAQADLEAQIKSHNLPIAVHALLLDPDKKKIIPSLKPRYTDLHRVHRALRLAFADQLDGAADYADLFKKQLDEELDPESDTSLKRELIAMGAFLKVTARLASAELRKTYAELQGDPSWQRSLGTAQRAAEAIKHELRFVARTEFPTPFDILIGSPHDRSLIRLEDVIAGRQDQAQVLATFLGKHPGLEHLGGVTRGGTFVLGYDTTGHVVADFMLPYLLEEPDDQAEEDGPIATPSPDAPGGNRGITFTASMDARLEDFWQSKRPEITKELACQKELFLTLKDFLQPQVVLSTSPITSPPQAAVKDRYLSLYLNELSIHSDKVDALNARLLDPSRSEMEHAQDRAALQVAQADLAASLAKTAEVVKNAEVVTPGSDAFRAIQAITVGAQKLSDRGAIETMKRGLGEVATVANLAVKGMLDLIANMR